MEKKEIDYMEALRNKQGWGVENRMEPGVD